MLFYYLYFNQLATKVINLTISDSCAVRKMKSHLKIPRSNF